MVQPGQVRLRRGARPRSPRLRDGRHRRWQPWSRTRNRIHTCLQRPPGLGLPARGAQLPEPQLELLVRVEPELKPERCKRLEAAVAQQEAELQRVAGDIPKRRLQEFAFELGALLADAGAGSPRPPCQHELPALLVNIPKNGVREAEERVRRVIRRRRRQEEDQGVAQREPHRLGAGVYARGGRHGARVDGHGPRGEDRRRRRLAQDALGKVRRAWVSASHGQRCLVPLEASGRDEGPALDALVLLLDGPRGYAVVEGRQQVCGYLL
mmetsp:Transcript_105395/g.280666  ORF Transcript_105395/g.280666 Transcript_105395/m.280666 type:complete len:267 (+) Transcript_105395:258-1058(+)